MLSAAPANMFSCDAIAPIKYLSYALSFSRRGKLLNAKRIWQNSFASIFTLQSGSSCTILVYPSGALEENAAENEGPDAKPGISFEGILTCRVNDKGQHRLRSTQDHGNCLGLSISYGSTNGSVAIGSPIQYNPTTEPRSPVKQTRLRLVAKIDAFPIAIFPITARILVVVYILLRLAGVQVCLYRTCCVVLVELLVVDSKVWRHDDKVFGSMDLVGVICSGNGDVLRKEAVRKTKQCRITAGTQ